jgi:hypothetical protein
MGRLIKTYLMKHGPSAITPWQQINITVEVPLQGLSSLSTVRHILSVSWEDSETHYPEDGDVFL